MKDPAWWRAASIAPAFLMFLLLTALPIAMLLALSVHDIAWTAKGVQWSFTGLRHYAALASDGLLRASVVNTLIFAIVAVALQMLLGLVLALLTSGIAHGQTAYRMVFLLPILIPGIVIGAIWKLMYSFDFGIINIGLGAIGLAPQDWLGERSLALGSVIAVDVWHWTPFCYLLLLAGLESLPQDVFEAARMDGARLWQTLLHVTLPLLAPTIAVTSIFRLILAFKVFDEVYFLTGGGPGTATEVLSFTIYRRFFTEDRAGYGAAMSVATFVLVTVLVLAAAASGRRRTA